MSDPQSTAAGEPRPTRLRDALRQARIEAADRIGVVVELRDAEVARLEILNEALDPLFAEVPGQVDLFDRGVSQGETPRLWIDVVAHVLMGRDKRSMFPYGSTISHQIKIFSRFEAESPPPTSDPPVG